MGHPFSLIRSVSIVRAHFCGAVMKAIISVFAAAAFSCLLYSNASAQDQIFKLFDQQRLSRFRL
jgi:hypothetical protein